MTIDILALAASTNRINECIDTLYGEILESVKIMKDEHSQATYTVHELVLLQTSVVAEALLSRARNQVMEEQTMKVLFESMKEKKENDRHSDFGHTNQEFGKAEEGSQ